MPVQLASDSTCFVWDAQGKGKLKPLCDFTALNLVDANKKQLDKTNELMKKNLSDKDVKDRLMFGVFIRTGVERPPKHYSEGHQRQFTD